ncbi:MAG: HAMP domain-containing sensor histidine kinase, partial [Pseudomonadota bacterium]
ERDTEQRDVPVWRKRFLFAQFFIGLAWFLLTWMTCSACDPVQLSILQFSAILIFNVATAMMSYSFGGMTLIMITPATIALAARFAFSQQPAMLIMAGVLLGSMIFFYLITKRFKESILDMLKHTTERETLIVELETEKGISEEARKRAEDANMAKSRFLATMSHELRTPLNAVIGFSEMMKDEVLGPLENESYREYSSDIHSSGTHLLKLINEILDISRIEAGKHHLEEQTLSLVSVVDQARHIMEVKARQKNVKLLTHYDEALATVWIDERAIYQVTLNLLSNALKFTPSGGTITLKVGWTAKGGQYISVKDTGPGIPENEIPVVLSSFGQGSIAIKDAEQGTGLGLTIVQSLLHMHQGRFDLKSKLREGTEAIAYLPKDRVTAKHQRGNRAMSHQSKVA